MLPAREHLETVEAAADKVDLLLEIWEELAVGNAAAEARFDGVAALQFPLHAAVEPNIATAAQLLRRVHRDIGAAEQGVDRSEEHTSELQSLMSTSYAVFCLKKKTKIRYQI